MTRTDVINYFAQKYDYKNYLEIGVCDASINFNKIIIPEKTGVDPAVDTDFRMASNEFFIQNTSMFDLIFIDGDHEASQVYKDIINSLAILKDNGTVIVHDCNPTEESYQTPHVSIPNTPWTGDGWKSFVRLRTEVQNYNMFVINVDFGVGIIRKSLHPQELLIIKEPITYAELNKNRIKWLNLIEWENIGKHEQI